jgi:hypothetical protein
MSQVLILIDALSSACWEKKEKKKREREREVVRGFSPRPRGQTCLAGCAVWALRTFESYFLLTSLISFKASFTVIYVKFQNTRGSCS